MKTRKRPGQTLVEVTMAAIVAAITTTAVFSVVLSSFVSDARADKRDAAAMALRGAQQALKGYVSVQPGDANYVPTGPSCVGCWSADASNVWALRDGTHNISSLVGSPPLGPGATLSYLVTSQDCGFGLGTAPNNELACKTVVFTLVYTD